MEEIMNHFDFTHDIKHIHFIGIGGISMSAIAEVLLNLGYTITGSDMNHSKIIDKLKKKGMLIKIGHHENNINDCDLIVYTAAIDWNNPELAKARSLNIPMVDRATMLGLLMKKFENSIAVSGTHGKTTTTSMISLVLEYAFFNPTIMVGGELDEIGGNVKIGGNEYFVTEACEYVESFLKFFPTMGVILNIDEDHLDYFKDINHIIMSFTKFAQLIPREGYLIGFNEDVNIKSLLPKVQCNVFTYGKNDDSDFQARNISYDEMGYPAFDLYHKNKDLGKFQLSIPGDHNINNALAAIACCFILGVPVDRIKTGLNRFRGTHRRFDIIGKTKDITIVDDYAHHPTEVKATLGAASKYPHNKIWCIFQPHTYTRTKALLKDFGSSFDMADKVIVTDIYAAREKDTGEIHSRDLAKEISQHREDVTYISDFHEIAQYINANAKFGDLVLTMGAGDVYRIGEIIIELNKEDN